MVPRAQNGIISILKNVISIYLEEIVLNILPMLPWELEIIMDYGDVRWI